MYTGTSVSLRHHFRRLEDVGRGIVSCLAEFAYKAALLSRKTLCQLKIELFCFVHINPPPSISLISFNHTHQLDNYALHLTLVPSAFPA